MKWKRNSKTEEVNEPTKENEIWISGEKITIRQINTEQFIEVAFLLAPYFKFIKKIRESYNSEQPEGLFHFISKTLISEIDKDDLYKSLSILLDKDTEFVKKIKIEQIISLVPTLIKENKMLEMYYIFKQLGAFE